LTGEQNSYKSSSEINRQETTDSNHWRDSQESSNLNAIYRDKQSHGTNESERRSKKKAKLLDALDEYIFSESEDTGLSSTAAGKDTLSQCKALRDVLRKQRNPVSSASASITIDAPASRTNHNGHADKDLPCIPPPLSLTPWTPASIPKTLPALPEINSTTLETATFTHIGVTSNASALSYERLEWLGDAYLYLVSTILISSTFTTHLPGKCAQIRELLVKNETLASYARHYGFEKRARLPSEVSEDTHKGHRAKEVEKTKVMGDIFEAYVAAVILSDPEQGVDRVSSWLKSLWAQTISKQIKDQERLNEKAKEIPAGDINANLNPKDKLSRNIGARGVKITYKDAGPAKKDPVTGFPLFSVAVYLDGWGEHDKQLGIGKALGKKEAGMKAAQMALANKKLMALYGEMKRVHDEKLKAEKERAVAEMQESS
jgi:ribonuclease-3